MIFRESRPIRLWPGMVIVILQWLLRFGIPAVVPEAAIIGALAGVGGGLAVVLWWLFLSRAPWLERLGAIILMIVALFATSRISHVSIATGAMGMLLVLLAAPFLSLALVGGAAAGRRLSEKPRRLVIAAAILLACGLWALVRTDGVTGNFGHQLRWRWSATTEEQLLAQASTGFATLPPDRVAAETPEKQLVAQPGSRPATALSVQPAPESSGKKPAAQPDVFNKKSRATPKPVNP